MVLTDDALKQRLESVTPDATIIQIGNEEQRVRLKEIAKKIFELEDLTEYAYTIYTDGARFKLEGPCGIGVVMLSSLTKETFLISVQIDATDGDSVYKSEICALHMGLVCIEEENPKSVHFKTDQKPFVQNFEGTHIRRVVQKDQGNQSDEKKKDPKFVENFVREVMKLKRARLSWVKSHSGLPNNEMADGLAGNACGCPFVDEKKNAFVVEEKNELTEEEKKELIIDKWIEHLEKLLENYNGNINNNNDTDVNGKPNYYVWNKKEFETRELVLLKEWQNKEKKQKKKRDPKYQERRAKRAARVAARPYEDRIEKFLRSCYDTIFALSFE